MQDVGTKVLLAIDGNSLVHRAFHAQVATGFRTSDGRPMWAVRGLVAQLLAAVERIDPCVVVVGFDDAQRNLRQDRWPQYKAGRVEKPEALVEQLDRAVRTIRELGVQVVIPPGLEADDVLASAARLAPEHGFKSVLMTSDRDAFALIDETTSVLRIINGGVEASPLLTPQRLGMMLGIRPQQYRDFAALRGDPSDNLPGVHGIGPKTAATLLAAFGSAAAVFADVAAGGGAVAETVGPAVIQRLADPRSRRRWELNCQVMAFHPDLELGLPMTSPEQLWPLSGTVVREVFGLLKLPSTLPTALRVLAHEDVPDVVERTAWSTDRSAEPAWWSTGGARQRYAPLPKPKPVVEQPALF